MTQNEFLSILEKHLGNISVKERVEILSDFVEHFAVAAEHGKTEAEVCEFLGDPVRLAEEFVNEKHGGDYRPAENFNDYDKLPATLQKGDTEATYHFDNFKDVYIDVSYCDIFFEKVKGELAQVYIKDEKNGTTPYKVHVADSTLTITTPKNTLFNSFFRNFMSQNATLRVGLPEHFNSTIEAKTDSGDIAADNLKMQFLKISTGSGDIAVNNTSSDMRTSTGSGNIHFSDCSANTAHVSTGSGNVKMLTFFAEEIKATTGSGNITVKNVSADKSKFSTGSGNIRAEDHVGTLSASTDSGNIRVTTTQISEFAKFSTGSGNVELYCSATSAPVTLSSGSGNLRAKIQKVGGDLKFSTPTSNIDLVVGNGEDLYYSFSTNKFTAPKPHCDFASNPNAPFRADFSTVMGRINVKKL